MDAWRGVQVQPATGLCMATHADTHVHLRRGCRAGGAQAGLGRLYDHDEVQLLSPEPQFPSAWKPRALPSAWSSQVYGTTCSGWPESQDPGPHLVGGTDVKLHT